MFQLRRLLPWNRKKDRYHRALVKMATSPATVNLAALQEEAKSTIYRYLQAHYFNQPDWLPVDKMEETMYLHIKNSTREFNSNLVSVVIMDIRVREYQSIIYMVHKVTYHVTYVIMQQQEPYELQKEIMVGFQFDERMGWIMEKVETSLYG